MKFGLPVFALSLLLISCSSTGENTPESNVESIDSSYCDCSDLVFDQPYNHFWRFERRKGYTGKCEEFYGNGQVKVTRNYVNGKVHGKQLSYYENGQLHEQKEFDMNLQIGEMLVYTNKGELKFHALYNRGKQGEILVNRPDLVEEDPWTE